jgi:hypothetical protein
VTGDKLDVCADVILDGSALSPPHDYTFNPAAIRLGHLGALVTSTTVANNYFNPDQDGGGGAGDCSHYSGISSFGASKVVVEANACAGCNMRHPERVCTVVSGGNSTVPTEFQVVMNSGEWTNHQQETQPTTEPPAA